MKMHRYSSQGSPQNSFNNGPKTYCFPHIETLMFFEPVDIIKQIGDHFIKI